jgi:N-acylglucosamine-6-phosphate 2-epimerase
MAVWADRLYGKVIISCQAAPGEPLHGPGFMAAMARAAEIGGAGAIRANGAEDIAAIRAAVSLPVIGISKREYPNSAVYITPTFEDAQQIAQAGAHLIALDGTPRPRPDGMSLKALVNRIHQELGTAVMADLSCLEDALASEEAGVDFLGTTLAGYTTHGRPAISGPDLDFITELAQRTRTPIIAEGRFVEPAQVAEAFQRGAWAVVVGSAVTRPQDITRRFVEAARQPQEKPSTR